MVRIILCAKMHVWLKFPTSPKAMYMYVLYINDAALVFDVEGLGLARLRHGRARYGGCLLLAGHLLFVGRNVQDVEALLDADIGARLVRPSFRVDS